VSVVYRHKQPGAHHRHPLAQTREGEASPRPHPGLTQALPEGRAPPQGRSPMASSAPLQGALLWEPGKSTSGLLLAPYRGSPALPGTHRRAQRPHSGDGQCE